MSDKKWMFLIGDATSETPRQMDLVDGSGVVERICRTGSYPCFELVGQQLKPVNEEWLKVYLVTERGDDVILTRLLPLNALSYALDDIRDISQLAMLRDIRVKMIALKAVLDADLGSTSSRMVFSVRPKGVDVSVRSDRWGRYLVYHWGDGRAGLSIPYLHERSLAVGIHCISSDKEFATFSLDGKD